MLLEMIYHSSDLAFWNHKVNFDGEQKVINVHPDVSSIDIKTDIYSSWKEWALLRDNVKYSPALRSVGGDPIGSGAYTGDTYFLINNWKFIADLTTLKVNGVLFSDDYVTAYYDNNSKPQYPATVSALVNTITTVQNVVTGDLTTVNNSLTALNASYIAPDNAGIAAIKAKTDTIAWQDVIDVRDEALGKWVLDPTAKTLTLYRIDGVTVLKVFNLTDTVSSVPVFIGRS